MEIGYPCLGVLVGFMLGLYLASYTLFPRAFFFVLLTTERNFSKPNTTKSSSSLHFLHGTPIQRAWNFVHRYQTEYVNDAATLGRPLLTDTGQVVIS